MVCLVSSNCPNLVPPTTQVKVTAFFRNLSTSWINQALCALRERLSRVGHDIHILWPEWSKLKNKLLARFAKAPRPHGTPFGKSRLQSIVKGLLETGKTADIWAALTALILAFTGMRKERASVTKWSDIGVSEDRQWIVISVPGGKASRENEYFQLRLPRRSPNFNFDFVFRLLRTVSPESEFLFANRQYPERALTTHFWTQQLLK